MTTTIRGAQLDDAPAVAVLLDELGYPTNEEQARGRLERVLGREHGGVLLATSGDQPVGLAAYERIELIYRPLPQCRLTALVVHPAHQRTGIATQLVRAVEERARALGCFRIEVTTNPAREHAVAFYHAAGFVMKPHRLVMALTGE